jgi:hypothetical protein
MLIADRGPLSPILSFRLSPLFFFSERGNEAFHQPSIEGRNKHGR